VLGQEIRTLVDAKQFAGYHLVRWDGRDNGGRPVGSGVYLLWLAVDNKSSMTRKLVLLR